MMANLLRWIRRRLPWIEPWYDWHRTTAFRIDTVERDFSDESEGEVWRFELQWLGVHIAIETGRTPPRIPAAVVASRKAERHHEA